jgi:hypothetical protein
MPTPPDVETTPPAPEPASVSPLSDVVLVLGWIVHVSRGIPERHRANLNTDLPGDGEMP